jgi:molybdate transport system substrate-binding protein
VANSSRQQASRALLDFLSSSKAEAAIRASGMEPASQKVTP